MSSPEDSGHKSRTSKTATYNQAASQGANFNGKVSGGVNTSTYGSGKNVISDSHNHSKLNVTTPNITGNTFNANVNVDATRLFQIIPMIFAFFHLAVNRGVLAHPSPENAAAGPVNYKMDDALTREDLDVEDEIGGDEGDDRSSTGVRHRGGSDDSDCDVLSLNDLDLRSIQAKSTTNAETYTRLMLKCCNQGLPCWYPRPLAGTLGIIPGDVGRFNLTDGFQKLFNVWDEGYADSWQAPAKTTRRRSDYFPEGYTIVNGASSTIRRSSDREYIEVFEFPRTREEGAVLACTTSADLEELEDPDSLRAFLIQHAGALYQRATSKQQLAEDSLYIITGCIKSASWGLAAYRGAPLDQVLRLEKWFGENTSTDKGKLYDWVQRGTGETPHWPTTPTEASSCGRKSHTLFLRGFKLAFSPEFRARVEGVKVKGTGRESCSGDHGTGKSKGPGNGLTRGNAGSSQPGSSASSLPVSNMNPSSSGYIQVDSFPSMAKTPPIHPCDSITGLLLEMTGADCALSHDDDWRHSLMNSSWNNTSLLDVFASKTISVFRGVAHLLPAHTDKLTNRTDDGSRGKAQEPNIEPHFYDGDGRGPLPNDSIPIMRSSSSSKSSQDNAAGGSTTSFFQGASKDAESVNPPSTVGSSASQWRSHHRAETWPLSHNFPSPPPPAIHVPPSAPSNFRGVRSPPASSRGSRLPAIREGFRTPSPDIDDFDAYPSPAHSQDEALFVESYTKRTKETEKVNSFDAYPAPAHSQDGEHFVESYTNRMKEKEKVNSFNAYPSPAQSQDGVPFEESYTKGREREKVNNWLTAGSVNDGMQNLSLDDKLDENRFTLPTLPTRPESDLRNPYSDLPDSNPFKVMAYEDWRCRTMM